MIGTLARHDRTQYRADWLKTNLAKFSRMMQGQRDLVTVGKLLLSELARWSIRSRVSCTSMEGSDGGSHLKELAAYADAAQKTAIRGAMRSARGWSGRRLRIGSACCSRHSQTDQVRVVVLGPAKMPSFCRFCTQGHVRRSSELAR